MIKWRTFLRKVGTWHFCSSIISLKKSLNNTLKHNVNIKLILYPFKVFIKRQSASFLFLHKIQLRNTFNNIKKCQIQHIARPIPIHLYIFFRMFRLKIYSDIKVPLYARIIHQRREISEIHNFFAITLVASDFDTNDECYVEHI